MVPVTALHALPMTLAATVSALLAPGKGILAADESFPTIAKRFKGLDLSSTEENRRAYRELLFTCPGLNQFISGVILFDETIRQKSAGKPFPEILTRQGIVPGIKVDMGTSDLANFPGEKWTQGLDKLAERLSAYRELGARFTKWRAVISIGERMPSRTCIAVNARALALFAALCQEAGLVPIVEPEVLMDGRHCLSRCEDVTLEALDSVFQALAEHRVALEGMVLKTGMVLSGKECPQQAELSEIAEATLRCLRRSVPAAVPGILFLSGGQRDVVATERLNAICSSGEAPWKLSFSYGRALQDAAMKLWSGSAAKKSAAQSALSHRAHCNSLAVQGRYSAALEESAAPPQ